MVSTLVSDIYSTSDREFLEVWSSLEFLDGLGRIRLPLQAKTTSSDFDLATVAGHFAYQGTRQNGHFYFGTNDDNVSDLDVTKLKEILPLDVLQEWPLAADEDQSPIMTMAQLRRRRAIEGLHEFRKGHDQAQRNGPPSGS